jgi:hypothetical protein
VPLKQLIGDLVCDIVGIQTRPDEKMPVRETVYALALFEKLFRFFLVASEWPLFT